MSKQTAQNVPPALVDCGCETTVYADGSGVEIHYCDMHAAAPQLLKALRRLVRATELRDNPSDQGVSSTSEAMCLARFALTAAEGPKAPGGAVDE